MFYSSILLYWFIMYFLNVFVELKMKGQSFIIYQEQDWLSNIVWECLFLVWNSIFHSIRWYFWPFKHWNWPFVQSIICHSLQFLLFIIFYWRFSLILTASPPLQWNRLPFNLFLYYCIIYTKKRSVFNFLLFLSELTLYLWRFLFYFFSFLLIRLKVIDFGVK